MVRTAELEARQEYFNGQINGVIEEAKRKLGDDIRINPDGLINLGPQSDLAEDDEYEGLCQTAEEYSKKLQSFVEQGGQIPE